MFLQGDGSVGQWQVGAWLCNASQASSADIATNPRDAANANGCIDSVISFIKTKLLPHVAEMTIRFIHSVESGMFLMCLPKFNFDFFHRGEPLGGLRFDALSTRLAKIFRTLIVRKAKNRCEPMIARCLVAPDG